MHPFNGRRIPIICDAELVDMSLDGPVTRSRQRQDPNDFNTGKRHGLEFINVFTEDGLVNDEEAIGSEGLKRFAARKP